MHPNFAFVKFLLDHKKLIVKLSDIKNFNPTSVLDFQKTRIYRIYWPQEDDEENIAKFTRQLYDATILSLGVSKEDFITEKRIVGIPRKRLVPPSDDSEIENRMSETRNIENERALLKTLERNKRKSPFCLENEHSNSSIISDSDEEEIEQLKRRYSSVKKKLKIMESGKQKNENSCLEKNEKITLKMEVEKCYEAIQFLSEKVEKSYEAIQFLSEKVEKNSENGEKLAETVGSLVKSINEFINFSKQSNESQLNNDMNKRSTTKDDHEIIQLGPIKVHKKALTAVESRKKNSIFVKDLAMLFWSEQEIIERSVTGRKAPNSKMEKDPKPPLTPEKLVAIREVFTGRLKDLKLSDTSIEIELRQMNKYLAEKINDLIKCKARKRLTYLEKVYENSSIEAAKCSDVNSPRPSTSVGDSVDNTAVGDSVDNTAAGDSVDNN